MIWIIKGISPTVLFSLSLVCHSKKLIYKQNRNLINRLFILIPYLNKFGKKKIISLSIYTYRLQLLLKTPDKTPTKY